MKNLIKYSSLILILIASLFISSCKKKESAPVILYGTLYFDIHTDIAATEVDSGTVAIDASGRHFKMNLAQFYISGIVLHKSDGTDYSVSKIYLLKTISNKEYYVDSVPAGSYNSISFNVGVDVAANAKLPTDNLISSPLYTQTPSMWFGNITQGYMFMNVQGMADTSAANNGAVSYPFIFQSGENSLLKTVNLPAKAFTVSDGSIQYVHIIADYGKLFEGVSFKSFSNYALTPFSNPSVAGQIVNNVPNMFRYE